MFAILCKYVIPSKIPTGNTIAKISPNFRLLSLALAIKPTTDGPAEQPTSPASAIKAYIAVPVFGKAIAAVLKVPGQKMPTEKPHTAQPISPMTELPDSAATR